MGSYQHFKDDFLFKLYMTSDRRKYATIGSLSKEYDILGPDVRVILTDWVKEQLISLKVHDGQRMCPLEEWSKSEDFFSTPPENPQILVELLPRGEDYATNVKKPPIGFRASGN
jgi:hypothetical protein